MQWCCTRGIRIDWKSAPSATYSKPRMCESNNQPIRNVQCIGIQKLYFLLPTRTSIVGFLHRLGIPRMHNSRIRGDSGVGCPVTARSLSLVTTLGLLLSEGMAVMEVRAKCDDRLSHVTITSLPYLSSTTEITRFNGSYKGAALTSMWCTICQRHWDYDMRFFIGKEVAIGIGSRCRARSIDVHLLDANAI
jgi:hypothetical protein